MLSAVMDCRNQLRVQSSSLKLRMEGEDQYFEIYSAQMNLSSGSVSTGGSNNYASK